MFSDLNILRRLHLPTVFLTAPLSLPIIRPTAAPSVPKPTSLSKESLKLQ